jgi:hypothetical protein
MNSKPVLSQMISACLVCALGFIAHAQVSTGSGGHDGVLSPFSSLTVNMVDHPDGIYQYSSVHQAKPLSNWVEQLDGKDKERIRRPCSRRRAARIQGAQLCHQCQTGVETDLRELTRLPPNMSEHLPIAEVIAESVFLAPLGQQ